MTNMCKWQPAIVDYEQLMNVTKKNDTVKEECKQILSGKLDNEAIKAGTLVYIVETYIDDYGGYNMHFCTVWEPSRQRYLKQALNSLRPLITEKDIIDMEMKFGNDLSQI